MLFLGGMSELLVALYATTGKDVWRVNFVEKHARLSSVGRFGQIGPAGVTGCMVTGEIAG